MEEVISVLEVMEAIRNLKKATGHDFTYLLVLLKEIWETGIIPKECEVGIQEEEITVLSVVAKLSERILENRLV